MVIVAGGTPGFIGNFLSLIRPLALYSRVRAKMTCDRQAQAKTKEGDLLTGELRSHSIRKNSRFNGYLTTRIARFRLKTEMDEKRRGLTKTSEC